MPHPSIIHHHPDANPNNNNQWGKWLAHPANGEEVVISGISGKFPDSKNMYQFTRNLFEKRDLVTDDTRRWPPIHPEVPQRTGKLDDLDQFDTGFFGIHYRQAHHMDALVRIVLEKSVEAIMDAGLHPTELEGSRTGVFVGACFSESERLCCFRTFEPQMFGITGSTRSMIANRISYYLKLKGPSCIVDTACSSSLYALEHAFKCIRMGECDNAIVGGSHLCLHPVTSLQFARLGVLSPDGACKVFDSNANGYARSEAIACVFLQKSAVSKRIYAKIVHAKINCDGYKAQGITFPSSSDQKQLLEEFYQDCQIDPSRLTFLEAHGTGTQVGDPEEVLAIDEVFTKNRNTPLLIGSVKSNIGHTEPSAGICSIAKVLIAMETGFVPPNINFTTPKEGIEGFDKGRLKVVAEKLPLPNQNGLIGINSFGFGGANCHVLLQWNPKEKLKGGSPSDDLPRLVCVSARQQEGIESILNDLKSRQLDAEFVWLLQEVFSKDFVSHHHRGFSILTKGKGEITRSFRQFLGDKPSLVFAFNHVKNWKSIVTVLMELPVFSCCLNKIHNVLVEKNVDLKGEIYGHKSGKQFSDILGSVTVQFCVLQVLKSLNIVPDFVVGHAFGQLICAFLDDCLTIEQVLFLAHESSKPTPAVLQKFKEIVPNPKRRTQKWLANTNFATSEFLYYQTLAETENLSGHPPNSLILDFGSSTSAKLSLSTVTSTVAFLELVGSLYENGFNPQIQNLYPEIKTVSRGTPMIAPLVKWNHDRSWFVANYKPQQTVNVGERSNAITTKDPNWSFVAGHVIDGRNLFPATGYLKLVWETLAFSIERKSKDISVVFENCKFHRATVVPKEGGILDLVVMIQRKSGHFEITEGGNAIVTGRIFIPDNSDKYFSKCSLEQDNRLDFTMESKDIYKELRLRGYNYKGAFRGLSKCNLTATIGAVKWDGNWVSFMDNMLQMKILQVDTRLLYVPTSIRSLTIDPRKHLSQVEQLGENPEFPVYINKENGIIKSGSVEIRGLLASSIARRKIVAQPVLEKYEFVPNETSLSLEQSLRVNLQLILENALDYRVKAVEVIDEPDQEPLSPLIFNILEDLPLIQPDLTIFSKQPLTTTIKIDEEKKLVTETDCLLVIGTKILQTTATLQQALGALHKNGFVLSKEDIDYQLEDVDGLDIATVHTTAKEKLVLFRKSRELLKKSATIDVADTTNFKWLAQAQNATKTSEEVVVYTQHEPLSGVLGLVNCLRREPSGNKFKCFFILDEAPKFNLEDPFYHKQLSKSLAVNVYKNGQWGSYRHLLLEDSLLTESEHCFVNATVRGDFSSLKWTKGPLDHNIKLQSEQVLVDIYYSALNFRDIMTASGRINADVITMDRLEQECVQGFEFSGRDSDGTRVMGMIPTRALSNLVVADRNLLIPVPDHWTLEEAATVPVVYGTVIYSLLVKGSLKRGQSILIHSGSGGIGIAAITVCLYYGCDVFTTVGSQEKRDFLLNHFPQLKPSHIGNSRNTSFVQMIQKETNGRGVHLVLNSLAEEKLIASIRCLAYSGTFLEIGKFDLANDNTISLLLLEKDANFHGCMLDRFFSEEAYLKRRLMEYIFKAIENGSIKPLPRTVFKMNEVEKAFRFMASGKHIGKVLVAIREETETQQPKLVPCIPRYTCNGDKVYIITGGLGGFGLELADWLVLRGARTLVLTSRIGIQTGYQAYRIKTWKSYGVSVEISTSDITTKQGCFDLITSAEKLGNVEAIFNLAVVLKDALLENQTVDNFTVSFGPKANATKFLDEATRKLCPTLRNFVVFSSVSCGRGNAGQTNYGMSNSVMERICEQRRADNFPALAVEFGAIGEVGLVAEMQEEQIEMEIGGTLQQRIASCLEVLDQFLHQNNTIVSSMVVAEKRAGAGDADNIIEAVANILGIRDLKTISLHSTLAELGMDSMIAVEIKQTLERDFEVFLTPQDIRNMTFHRLYQIQDDMKQDQKPENLNLFKIKPLEGNCNIPAIPLKSRLAPEEPGVRLLIVPGLEGVASYFDNLAANLDCHVLGLQYKYANPDKTIGEMAKTLLPVVEENLNQDQFCIVGYSFGSIIAMEIAAILEAKGLKGRLLLIDGSPEMMKELLKTQVPDDDVLFQTELLCQLAASTIPIEVLVENRVNITKCPDFEERMNFVQTLVPKELSISPDFQKQIAVALYTRVHALFAYEPALPVIKSPTKLYKPSRSSLPDFPEDYKLGKMCQTLDTAVFHGTHTTILDNTALADDINALLRPEDK